MIEVREVQLDRQLGAHRTASFGEADAIAERPGVARAALCGRAWRPVLSFRESLKRIAALSVSRRLRRRRVLSPSPCCRKIRDRPAKRGGLLAGDRQCLVHGGRSTGSGFELHPRRRASVAHRRDTRSRARGVGTLSLFWRASPKAACANASRACCRCGRDGTRLSWGRRTAQPRLPDCWPQWRRCARPAAPGVLVPR